MGRYEGSPCIHMLGVSSLLSDMSLILQINIKHESFDHHISILLNSAFCWICYKFSFKITMHLKYVTVPHMLRLMKNNIK